MTTGITAATLKTVENYDENQRFNYLLAQIINNNELWLLTDEHGCMMLNSDDEDCVPIWPNKEFAELWINDDWQACKAESISLNKWFSRWTHGLLDDDLSIVAFPNQQQEGLVLYADEFEYELKKQQLKKRP
jgi:uncharacterized protein DUF2750